MEKVLKTYKYGADFKPVAIKMLGAFWHLAITNVDFGVEDYVEVCMVDRDEHTKITKCKVYYGDRPYFKKFGCKHYIDEFARVEYPKGFQT